MFGFNFQFPIIKASPDKLEFSVPECRWVRVFAPFTLHWISVGQAGIWGVHKPNGSDLGQIYYVHETRNRNRPEAFSWQQVHPAETSKNSDNLRFVKSF